MMFLNQSLALWVSGLVVLGVPGRLATAKEFNWQAACERLVQQKLVPSGIDNPRVLESMRNTPRHLFVPADQRENAYYDMALPIGSGQTISPPFIVATMTQAIDPQPADKVLEIGTGSGYQSAILSPLVAEVYTIEIVQRLGQRARQVLHRLHYKNVHTKIGDGYLGWPSQAPFDKILVTCSPEKVPPDLVEQLREGGRMVIPVGERYQQTLFLMKKTGDKLVADALEPTFFVPMTGQAERLRDLTYDASRPRLINGSFEQGEPGDLQLKGWYYLRQGRLFTEITAPDGEQVLIFNNTTAGRGAQALQAFGIDGRTVHKLDLSLWVKEVQLRPGRTDQEMARLEISFFDRRRAPIRREVIGPWQGTSPWEKKQRIIHVPPQARLAVLAVGMFGGVGQLSIDAVQVQELE
jgi:protein-L-isoaspartate(D-aspartate) O-methyltransferase